VVTNKPAAAATSDLSVSRDTTEQQANQLAVGNAEHNNMLMRMTRWLS